VVPVAQLSVAQGWLTYDKKRIAEKVPPATWDQSLLGRDRAPTPSPRRDRTSSRRFLPVEMATWRMTQWAAGAEA
jgi:hypothetical protein